LLKMLMKITVAIILITSNLESEIMVCFLLDSLCSVAFFHIY
jgi:hypothetical protein